uniref:Ribonuclease A-domain domain-containing protein n=1 Tax=Poecilia latipinna TaxID=48699 RepID=A0A3B3TX10_9TELE
MLVSINEEKLLSACSYHTFEIISKYLPKYFHKQLIYICVIVSLEQHVDKKMAAQKCTAVMKQKKIYDDNNVCKKTNTFILADAKEVQSVCKGQGIYNNESHYTESKKKFRVVVCTVKKQARKPKCEYNGKCLKNRVIAVSCKDGNNYVFHFLAYKKTQPNVFSSKYKQNKAITLNLLFLPAIAE